MVAWEVAVQAARKGMVYACLYMVCRKMHTHGQGGKGMAGAKICVCMFKVHVYIRHEYGMVA